VSARVASPAVEGSAPSDPVRALQHALYRAAKADPGRRFHSLRDKVYRRDVLWRAWFNVRRNTGAAGIDKTTLAMVEEYGVTRLLDEVANELRDGGYRPLAARRVFIPKPGTVELTEEQTSRVLLGSRGRCPLPRPQDRLRVVDRRGHLHCCSPRRVPHRLGSGRRAATTSAPGLLHAGPGADTRALPARVSCRPSLDCPGWGLTARYRPVRLP
jgi:hypothetical protein